MSNLLLRLPVVLLAVGVATGFGSAADAPHPLLTWVKRHPLPGAAKPSPHMGYETTYGYDPASRLLIRHSGHNQGGGGEQNAETWTYDLDKDLWALIEPNDAPPGVCCGQQNVFDDAAGLFVRFPAFSGSHGWQSFREIRLKDSIWTFNLATRTWRAMRPCPAPRITGLRGAAYDPHHGVIVVHGGETAGYGTVVYDLYANTVREMKPAGPAPEGNMSQPGFTYDAVNRVFVLFGSQFQSDPRTWLYDLDKNTWRVLQTADHPPHEKTSPLLAADTRSGIVLCSVQSASESGTLETWVLDVAKAAWKRLPIDSLPGKSGNRNRALIYLADRNLFVLENRTRAKSEGGVGDAEQQIWTFRYADAPLPAPPPRIERKEPPVVLGLVVSVVAFARPRAGVPRGTAALGCALSWEKSPANDVTGYHVERAEVSVYSSDEVKRVKERYKPISDLAAGAVKGIGKFQRLTAAPLADTKFADTTLDLAAGQKEPAAPLTESRTLHPDQVAPGKAYRFAAYAYRVVAVSGKGVESGPSPLVFTWPSAVQYVFSKEEGQAAARIKWKANPEKGLKGYLVYRHDGRYDREPIVRLTPEPIAATEFLDPAAGKDTRRYEVVAVDSLGQEGEPSQPVWARREWERFYKPYTGEWHQ